MDNYLGMPGNHLGKTFDKLLELAATGSTLTNKTATSAVYIGDGLVDADLVIDVNTSTGTENSLAVQLCAKSDFSSDVKSILTISIPENKVGRIIAPFRNDPDGTPLPYIRLMPAVTADSGALKLGAFMAKK